ncbi:MAG TPA: S8 family serine peptidase, partial [candidate division Zixibacteria bacterium]|nr:S8 family serine peptidase [candidate division Zixibacteria bacterium]
LPAADLAAVAALPFVAEIRPVAVFKRSLPDLSEVRSDGPGSAALAPDALNYGYAQAQLEQINVPAVHEKGLDGSGVTLAVFDTGFRKTHEVFANAFAEGRVLAEWDFVFNDGNTDYEPSVDWSSSTSHGTLTWSTSGGYKSGRIIGPAYRANFLLAKTEDVRSETSVEEDNWVAALEWADTLGADVITSSLGYSDWYSYSDMDGQTCITTIAAATAAGLGIVVVNSMGNEGPGSGTLTAPADAHPIIACGAVDINGSIAGFSSRGPTYDGRMKPEVVACGVSTSAATNGSDISYGTASGTSLSTPLVAGAAVLLVQAQPSFTPEMIRLALMQTADRASSPDNTYGWGLIDADAATSWGVSMAADSTINNGPLKVHFTGTSALGPTSWLWRFGDGDSATVQNPAHTYSNPGAYDVSLTVETSEFGQLTTSRPHFIIILGDTAHYGSDSTFAGSDLVVSINVTNSQPLARLVVPLTFGSAAWLTFDSVTRGDRTAYFERLNPLNSNDLTREYVYELLADFGGGSPPLAPGSGEVLKLWFSTDELALGGQSILIDSIASPYVISFEAGYLTYSPTVAAGTGALIDVMRGDVNYDHDLSIADVTHLVAHFYRGGPPPVCLQAGDVNRDFMMSVADLTYYVAYLFRGGPPPPTP